MIQRMFMVLMAAMLVGAAAACGTSGGDSDDGAGGGALFGEFGAGNATDGAGEPAEESADSPSGGDDDRGTVSSQGTLLDRKVIFTATIELEAEDVRMSFERASQIARQSGGFVESSSMWTRSSDDGEERDYATITMRVPVSQYDGVLNSLRSLTDTEVQREETGSTEVTEEYTDLESRLRNLERTESQYLSLLDRAETIDDILTVNDRLDGVRAQIEQIQGRMNLLDNLTELAAVSLEISPMSDGAPAVNGDEKSFGEVFADAMEWSVDLVSRAAAASAIVVVAAIWLAGPLAVLIVLSMVARRRGSRGAEA